MLYESGNVRLSLNGGTATLAFEFAGPGINSMSGERLLELDAAVQMALANPFVNLLVLKSSRASGFCDGYDWNRFESTPEFAALGQQVLQRFSDAPCITIAHLHGPVLDAGLDLALACDYRFAVALPGTMLGWPGLQHGLLSPWGGMTRLTRIVGASKAVEMIANESPVNAREAYESGLVDFVCCERRAMIDWRLFLQKLKRKPRRWQTPLDRWAAKRVVGAYEPWRKCTPHAAAATVLDVIPAAARSVADGLRMERVIFQKHAENEPAQAAISLHRDAMAMKESESPIPERIAVVGGPDAFSDELLESLLKQQQVHVFCGNVACLERGIAEAVKSRRVTPLEGDQARSRLRVPESTDERYDLVLMTEANAAALELVETIANPLAAVAVPHAELASLQKLSCRSRNLIGWHRVNSIIELFRAPETHSKTMQSLQRWLSSFPITSIVMSVEQGTLSGHLQAAWWDEAVRLVADGVPIHRVDEAAGSFGAEAGPLETLDRLGLESVAPRVPRLKPLLAAGILGRPYADGFYVCNDNEPTCANAVAQLVLLEAGAKKAPRRLDALDSPEQLRIARRRLKGRLTAAALQFQDRDDYLSERDLDLAVVYGLGLFRREGGLRANVNDLADLQAEHGDRFKLPRRFHRAA